MVTDMSNKIRVRLKFKHLLGLNTAQIKQLIVTKYQHIHGVKTDFYQNVPHMTANIYRKRTIW